MAVFPSYPRREVHFSFFYVLFLSTFRFFLLFLSVLLLLFFCLSLFFIPLFPSPLCFTALSPSAFLQQRSRLIGIALFVVM